MRCYLLPGGLASEIKRTPSVNHTLIFPASTLQLASAAADGHITALSGSIRSPGPELYYRCHVLSLIVSGGETSGGCRHFNDKPSIKHGASQHFPRSLPVSSIQGFSVEIKSWGGIWEESRPRPHFLSVLLLTELIYFKLSNNLRDGVSFSVESRHSWLSLTFLCFAALYLLMC